MAASEREGNGGNEHCHGQLGQDVRETMSIKVGRMTFKQSNLQPGQVERKFEACEACQKKNGHLEGKVKH